MITVTYTCDKCKEQIGKREEMWTAYCGAAPHNGTIQREVLYIPVERKIEVCRPCLDGMGLSPEKRKYTAPANPPTLEDLITEIASEAAIMTVNNR